MQIAFESAMYASFVDEAHYRFMLLAKLHLMMFLRNLHAFVAKLKECREHVLRRDTVLHEPDRLIQASPWGDNLFPQKMVDEVKACAVKDKTYLTTHWRISSLAAAKAATQQKQPQPPRGQQ